MFNTLGANQQNIGPEANVRSIFTKPDREKLLDTVASKCGFYYSEFEEVLIDLLARLLHNGFEQGGKTLPPNIIQQWLITTLNHTAQIAERHPLPERMTVDGYTLIGGIKTATQQYLNIRNQDYEPIDNDPATLDFSGQILRSAGLINNPFQPNAVLVVLKSAGRDTLYRCQNPLQPTLNTVAARSFQIMATSVVPTNTPRPQRSSFFKF